MNLDRVDFVEDAIDAAVEDTTVEDTAVEDVAVEDATTAEVLGTTNLHDSLATSSVTADEVSNSPSPLVILSKGHQLCNTCIKIITDEHSPYRLPSNIWPTKPYHQNSAAFLQAAKLPCYICSRIYDRIISHRRIQHSSGVARGPYSNFESIYLEGFWESEMNFDCQELIDNTELVIDLNEKFEAAPKFAASTGDPTVLQLAAVWLKTCLQEHTCNTQDLKSSWQPTRLLDVKDWRLVLTSKDPISGPYATLSYRWGDRPSFLTLTSENINQLRLSITLESLPKVFCDAIEVTRALGIRYLWIDALCILQSGEGSQRDWEFEGAQMRYVYSNCQVNIAASYATQPEDGLFATRDTNLLKPLQCQVSNDFWKLYFTDALSLELTCSPLTKRAWVLQERILSPRSLIFGRHEIFWECQELALSEIHDDGYGPYRTERVCPFSIRNICSGMPTILDMKIWWKIIADYSSRSLTRPSTDKFIALAAVAEEVGLKYKDEYVAGFFRKQLPQTLTWKVNCAVKPKCRPEPYRAPSWSWASIDAEVALDLNNFLPIADRSEHCARLIDVQVKLVDDGNRFGRIRSASIELHGLAGRIDEINFLSKDLWRLGGRTFQPNFDTLIDKEVPQQDLTIFLIRAAIDCYAGHRTCLEFLMLKQSKTEENAPFIRIGMIEVWLLNRRERDLIFEGLTKRNICII